ncbi:hypothetical protein Slin15195_G076900 [Septoria linicola]|uniref:DUF7924 domain-containing protein n=1 Tax=Septoria linicola TaxID=215465 RepID=A0A9Q9B130_9PEZI|nr:hypothetical protein Slin14017_G038070 [Septoria linicola]USW54371.1 hypothetical protein Slin15195_G076900 [Septoria linicola]
MARRSQSAPTTCRVETRSPVTKTTASKATRRSNGIATSNTQSSIVGISCLLSPESEILDQGPKRKRAQNLHHLSPGEPVLKKTRLLPSTTQALYHTREESNSEFGADVCWGDYFGQWPPMEADRGDRGRFGRLGQKRSNSQLRSSSYSQSVRDGESPQAWTRQHEEKMEEAGLVMKEYQTQAAITSACQRLCDDLKKRDCSPPHGPSFERDRLLKILDLVRFRNEARVVRDIMPLVVPSPELLNVDGHQGMDQMSEAMDAEWLQCNTICGPRPKPDFAVGISSSAFAEDEKVKLRLSHTSACPNLFPENMYYPFLICEVKGSDRPIQEAERQSMHSASIAVRAIVQLYRKISATDEVDRRILAFSVAHNNTTVKIFGHFARVEEQKLTFFRCRLYTADFATDFGSDEWAKPYGIIRAIYDVFFPQHLARITGALTRLRGRALESFTSHLGLDEDSQESVASQPSSQEQGTFKRPTLPSMNKMQQENDRLRDQLAGLLREQRLQREQQMEELREQRASMDRQLAQQKEQMERQLVQQREEAREQKTAMEGRLAQQKEQMEHQLAQQKEQMEHQLAQQKEQMEHQLAHQKEIIGLLKERRLN